MVIEIIHVQKVDPRYPVSLTTHLGSEAPLTLAAIGDMNILDSKPLAVFSSVKCPGSVILKTYDLMKKLRDRGVTIISGFHSPIEKECLNILLKGKQPVIMCPARSIEGMRINPELRLPLEDGRLLILSPFAEKDSRISSGRALDRNRFVAALASAIFIAYAAPSSNTERLRAEVLTWETPLFTFSDERSRSLLMSGAKDIEAYPRLSSR